MSLSDRECNQLNKSFFKYWHPPRRKYTMINILNQLGICRTWAMPNWHTQKYAWRQSLAALCCLAVLSACPAAGQSRLLLTLTRAAWDYIKSTISNIRKGPDHVLANAPQLPKANVGPHLHAISLTKYSNRPKNSQFLGSFPPCFAIEMI